MIYGTQRQTHKTVNIIPWHLTGMQTAVWRYCLCMQCRSFYIELTHRWLDSSQLWCCDFGLVVPNILKDYSVNKISGTTPLNGTVSHPRRLSSSETWMVDPQTSQIIHFFLLLFCYILQLLSTILWQHIFGLNIHNDLHRSVKLWLPKDSQHCMLNMKLHCGFCLMMAYVLPKYANTSTK